MADDSRRNRWYDSTKVIYGLFSLVGALLAGTLLMASSAILTNERDIDGLQDMMRQQVQEVNQALNAHLRDPSIHHAGMGRLGDKIDAVLAGVQDLKTEQRAIRTEQQRIRTDLAVIKDKVE